MEHLRIEKLINDESISSVQNILGIYFVKLKNFFEKSFFDFKKNICSVLVTRRCFLMAIWFLGYFLKQETFARDYEIVILNSCICIRNRKSGHLNYIISDKGIPFLHLLKNVEEIYILDDICIHGRQLENIKLEICEATGFSESKVKKSVFMKSEESIVRDVDYAEAISIDGQWVMPSKRIVEAINFLLLPYVSYINSYVNIDVSVEKNDEFLESLFDNNNLIVKAFGKDNRLQLGKQSFYIVEKNQIISDNESLACIRYYYNFETQVASIIPYVILQPLKDKINKEKIKALFSEYLKKEAVELLTKELDSIFKDDFRKGMGFVYNLLSCVASYQYGIYFSEKYSLDKFNFINKNNQWDSDITCSILMAYGKKLADIVLDGKNYIARIPSPQFSDVDTKIDLLDFKVEIDDFTKERWEKREVAAMDLTVEPAKKRLTTLIQGGIDKKSDKETDPIKYKSIISYSILYDVINSCDNGRLSIASTIDCGDSFLEVGELGVITVREAKEKSEDIQKLLLKKYYYYILC